MDIREKIEGSTCRLEFEGDLTVYEVAEVKPTLIEALKKHDAVECCLDGVGEIDTAGMQLLIMARLEATTEGKRLCFGELNPVVAEIVDLFGLAGFFEESGNAPQLQSA
ncbi:MAG: STAS domain-containing protein [Acidihalobacter sp.]|jgi:anti-sigma B factor antagonist|uniref:STAS domain-containing protein n=1 Tax=Acidihalobacter sp. TaxID=1872108 RepID=UPI00307E556B